MAIKGNSDKFRKMLWPRIEDSSAAMDAMKLAQWVGLLIGIGYGMALVIAISSDLYPDGTQFEDEAELYGIVFIYFVLILLALLFWLLARWGKGWAVLFISTWGLFEAVVKLFTLPGQGVILAMLTLLFCLSGFRGWLGVRKYGRPGDEKDEAEIAE